MQSNFAGVCAVRSHENVYRRTRPVITNLELLGGRRGGKRWGGQGSGGMEWGGGILMSVGMSPVPALTWEG